MHGIYYWLFLSSAQPFDNLSIAKDSPLQAGS